MLTLTSDATDVIERILEEPSVPDGAGLRIAPTAAATGGATAGSELQVTVAEEPDTGDAVIEEEGARVFVEDTLAEFLEDKELDAQVVDERVNFTIGRHLP